MFVHLSEEEVIHFTVQTPDARVSALTPGAEFDVCRTDELTCVVVKRGVVEVVAKNKREVVKAGSAGVVLNDQPPSPAICASVPRFITWEQRFRLSATASSLPQEIASLPQGACPVGADGLPVNAHILYQDEFNRTSQGWDEGEFDLFTVGYARLDGGMYYQVQAQSPEDLHLSFAPNGSNYDDVNIDVKARVESASEGDFRYGIALRRSGDQYYVFAVSPVTRTWYFLKSSSNGLQILKEGVTEWISGSEEQDSLRVEASGSTFFVFINNRFIDWISDPDYARGEVGFFVQTVGNPDARINFDSITIWNVPASVFNPQQGERCFNAIDDDADGLIDQADPDCQHPDQIITFPTIAPLPTSTPRVIKTSTSAPTSTKVVRTPTQPPTSTRRPTRTPTPRPTSTRRPTRTPTRLPTDPPTIEPTETQAPPPTDEPTETQAPPPTTYP
jgi:hypothetical protein